MVEIEMRCEKCDRKQPIDKGRSDASFMVYDCHERCVCGGKYIIKPVGDIIKKGFTT
jgi:hypothetical protein